MCSLVILYLRRDKLDAAEASFTCALDFYAEKQDRWYIASCSFGQGRTCLRRQDFDGAGAALTRALALWREVNELWGTAAVNQAFGDLHLCSDRLDDAEISLNLALNIFTTQVESRTDEARTNRSFGKLYLRRSQFVDCERVLRRALELDIIAGSRVGQAQSHRELGAMFMKKAQPAAAESSYADALRLFLKIEDYQATSCLFELGSAWVQQGKMEESDALISELLRVRWDAEEEIRKPKDGVVVSTS
ncbi:hypothetical protein DL96DRAFT_1717500 [Flagelloscypha sp. PMI_526]|nr:hypothetical protein DL96DRAFT_1717500 [Flagelloscypha sp. PMI_526]